MRGRKAKVERKTKRYPTDLSGIEACAWRSDVLAQMVEGHSNKRLDDLLPETSSKLLCDLNGGERTTSHRLRPLATACRGARRMLMN
jgi:hypothetical protein